MKIKANEALKALNGEALVDTSGKGLTIGAALANMLIAYRREGEYEFDKIKSYVLAQKLYTDKDVDIDEADIKGIKKVIKSDAVYGPLVSGKILLLLDNGEKIIN